MEKNYNIDDIENFLNQEMDAAELAAFEKEMANDEALKTEVNFHEDVVKGIKNAGPMAFKDLVAGVHSEMKTEGFFEETVTDKVEDQTVTKEAKVRSISIFRRLAIAASFALLLTAGWFMFAQPNTPEQLFADNFTIHQDVLSVEIEDRLAETGFGTNKEALNKLQQGINSYTAGDYQQAINQFSTFQSAAGDDALADYARFYQAISLLETKDISKAQEILEKLITKPSFPLIDDANWYLALIYLKQDNKQGATFILRTLSLSDTYKERAAKLLESYL